MGDPHGPPPSTPGHPSISTIPPPAPSPTKSKSFSSLFQKPSPDPSSSSNQPLIPPSFHHGEPAFKISQEMVEQFSKPFAFTLVGKFSHGRPTLERARLYFAKFNLKGQ